MSSGSPSRPSRPGGSRGQGRSGGSSKPSRPAKGRAGGTAGKGRPAPKGRQSGRGGARPPRKPLTEAERRSIEVKARRGPRPPRDPEHERQKIAARETETWIDEGEIDGGVRRAATGAVHRAEQRRTPAALAPEVSSELTDAVGRQRAARLAERLAQASEALDRERFQEAGRIATAIAKEVPSLATAHEVAGLAAYRLGRYKQAAKALVTAQELRPEPALLPVIADCYRAQRRWAAVDRVWTEIKAASPSHEVMAEGRIVAAGALADRGDLRGALAVMEPAMKRPRAVRDLHLRQWYVVADLYDRVGDPISARRWFGSIADADPDFADVEARLRGLGR